MRVALPRIVFVVAVALGVPSLAAGQDVVKSFSQLNTRVSVGDTVRVTDAQGRKVTGRIIELHDASITLDNNGQTPIQGDSVRLVQHRTKAVGRAALWGLLIGGAAGVVLVVATDGDCSDCGTGWWAVGLGIGAGIGAGVGAAVRAALPPNWKEVYRAPAASGSARFSIAPVITPRTKGVALTYSFSF